MLKLIFLSPMLRQFMYVEIANFSIIILGITVVWGSPMVIKLGDTEQTVLPHPITETETAWLVSISFLTAIPGSIFGGILMDKLGRRNTIICSYIPRLLFCFLAIFANDIWMLLLARCFSGIADMICLVATSTYSSEIANKEIRGAVGTMTQINSAIGMLIMLGIGPFVSYLTMNILMTCIVGASLIPLLFIPDSPFFLYTKGETSKSIEVLTYLYGTEEQANEEIKSYSSNTEEINKLELLKDKIVIKTLFMVFFLAIGLQMNGYNIVNMYLQTIMESANTTVSSDISSLIVGLIQLTGSVCCFFLTNGFGRKTIICSASAGMLVGMVGLGTFFTLQENGKEIMGFFNYLPLISAGIVIFGFNAGLGSLFWILIAELLYGPARAQGMALGGITTNLTSFLLTLLFPTLNAAIGASGTYWIFSVGCVSVGLFVALFVPETKNKTFTEIQTALGRSIEIDCDAKDHIHRDGNLEAQGLPNIIY